MGLKIKKVGYINSDIIHYHIFWVWEKTPDDSAWDMYKGFSNWDEAVEYAIDEVNFYYNDLHKVKRVYITHKGGFDVLATVTGPRKAIGSNIVPKVKLLDGVYVSSFEELPMRVSKWCDHPKWNPNDNFWVWASSFGLGGWVMHQAHTDLEDAMLYAKRLARDMCKQERPGYVYITRVGERDAIAAVECPRWQKSSDTRLKIITFEEV